VTFGVMRWWVSDDGIDDETESALAGHLTQLGVSFADWSSRTMTLRFPGSADDAQEAFEALRVFLRDWKRTVANEFGAQFRVTLAATLSNAFGDL
jgi:hypothetical protein